MNTTQQLSEQEKTERIAKACGWNPPPEGMGNRTHGGGKFMTSEEWRETHLPSYFHSLDAMAEAENVLTDAQRFNFAYILAEIVLATPGDPPNFDLSEYGPGAWAGMKEVSRVISATAAQRAEAFGISCGLWT